MVYSNENTDPEYWKAMRVREGAWVPLVVDTHSWPCTPLLLSMSLLAVPYLGNTQLVEPCPRFAHQLVYDHVNEVPIAAVSSVVRDIFFAYL